MFLLVCLLLVCLFACLFVYFLLIYFPSLFIYYYYYFKSKQPNNQQTTNKQTSKQANKQQANKQKHQAKTSNNKQKHIKQMSEKKNHGHKGVDTRNKKIINPYRTVDGSTIGGGKFRDKATINRLAMYRAKAKHDRDGNFLYGPLMSRTPDAKVKRIQPDRRWFVVGLLLLVCCLLRCGKYRKFRKIFGNICFFFFPVKRFGFFFFFFLNSNGFDLESYLFLVYFFIVYFFISYLFISLLYSFIIIIILKASNISTIHKVSLFGKFEKKKKKKRRKKKKEKEKEKERL